MVKMKTPVFIINLKTSLPRKEYMKKILSEYNFLDINFVEAIDGRIYSETQQRDVFDMKACLLRNGRLINPGEIGCTLSHRKCYKKLLDSSLQYALILEDDISIIGDLKEVINDELINFIGSKKPRILFLSGDYWYWNQKHITKVCWAVGSYAYFINRAAAERILRIEKPFNVADDWDLYKRKGIALHAIHPYVIDANISGFPSDIQQEHWGNMRKSMSLENIIRSTYMGLLKRYLAWIGHFESKFRNE